MPVANVNLLWTRRFRGVLPLSANALDAAGTLAFVRPDELEARTYQVTHAGADGRVQVYAALTVETVSKMEVALGGAALLGVTDDDLYLFREERKSRFMPGRRASYSDVALSAEGRFFAAAFSDMMFASHSVALCEMSGKTVWTKDLDFAVARVKVAPDGRALVVGGEQGVVLCFDAMRSALWEALLEQPVTALALAGSGRCVVGDASGGVTALDAGSATWRTDVGLPVVALAVADAGDLTAVAAGDTAGGVLLLLEKDGVPAWEYALDVRPTGVSLTPDGTRVAVSSADGSLAVFSFDRTAAAAAGAPGAAGELATITARWEEGERWEARGRLAELLQRSPGTVEACDLLIDWDAQLVAEALAEAERLTSEGAFAEALARLDAAHNLDPDDGRLPPARLAIVERASAVLRERAAGLLQAGDAEGAMQSWQALLTLCPKDREAHAELAVARRTRAETLAREGDACAAAGRLPDAIDLWRRAQAMAPGDEIARRLQDAELSQSLERGKHLYQERRYPEAVFQLRKVLAIDPDHEEAQRYLGYAESMRPGSPVADRFTRLE